MLLWQLIVIQVITFALLVIILRQFLYKQNSQALARLQQLYQENLKREEDLKKAQEEAEKELKEKTAQNNKEIVSLRAASEMEARRMQEEIIGKVKEEAKRMVIEAEAKKEQMRANLVSEMEEKALGLASDILQHIFTAQVAQGIHHSLIDEFIGEIEKSDGQKLQLDVEAVEIAAPYPLTQLQEENLKKMLSSKMGRPVSIKGTIDQEIVAGMVVRMENLVLDGSLRNKLKGTLAYVRDNLSRPV